MQTKDFLKTGAASLIGGYVATKAMEPVSMKLYEMESEKTREREDSVRPGPPYNIAAEKTAKLLGIELAEDQVKRWGMAFHYGLGISWVPVYLLLRRRLRMPPVGAGLVAGATMSLIVDEGMTPALGFSAPNREYPLATHLRGFVAHLAYGLAVAASVEGLSRILRRF